jgi:SpoVK/Ycf46/Vps4 family AAA+-type ATPase
MMQLSPSLAQTVPLHVFDSPQLRVPTSVVGVHSNLLPLQLELYIPATVRSRWPFECTMVRVSVADTVIVATVTVQIPNYVNQSTLPVDAVIISAVAQRIFLPGTVESLHSSLIACIEPIPSYALPMWAVVHLRLIPFHQLHTAVRDMPSALHPMFRINSCTDLGIDPQSMVQIRRQLMLKPVFAGLVTGTAYPLMLLAPDGQYRCVQAIDGQIDGVYEGVTKTISGWGIVGASTQFVLESHATTITQPDDGTALATVRPLDLSIDDLFRIHLPSYEEGLSAIADEELKSFAMLLKSFSKGTPHVQQHSHTRSPVHAPTLLHPSSLMLSGMHGTGKQSFIRSLSSLFNLDLHTLSFGKLILRRGVASQTESLRAHLTELRSKYCRPSIQSSGSSLPSRCLLLLPAMELTFAVSDERDEDALGLQTEMIQFMRELEGNTHQNAFSSRILVVGLTNERTKVAASLIRAFQFRFQVTIPSDAGRARILAAHLFIRSPIVDEPNSTDSAPIPSVSIFDASSVDVSWLAEQTVGFVGADLVSLIKTAVAHAIQQRNDRESNARTPIRVNNMDFQYALTLIHPASLKSLSVISKPRPQLPSSSSADGTDAAGASVGAFSSVGGLELVKSALRESLLWPFRHRSALKRLVRAPSSGMLLYGPPGVGKTMLCRSVASECGVNFLAIRLQDLLASGVGESEKRVVEMFARARAVAPAVLFLDEVQAIFSSGSSGGGSSDMSGKMMSQLLQQLDQLNEEFYNHPAVFVLAATNMPWALDPALLRSGRLDRVLYVPPPDVSAREMIMKLNKGVNVQWSPELIQQLPIFAKRTEGFSASDMVHLVSRAGLYALHRAPLATESEMVVLPCDFESALQPPNGVTASITPQMITACTNWGKRWRDRHAIRRQFMLKQENIKLIADTQARDEMHSNMAANNEQKHM